MTESKTNASVEILVAISFLVMIVVNALSNILPINGLETGQISDSYKNLFAPAGLTFAIWGLIYLLLLGYTLYQLGVFKTNNSKIKQDSLIKIGLYFSISSIVNAAWIFSWHYKVISLSMLLMLVIFICLIMIVQELKKSELSPKDRFFIKLPFSVYFGWITVATIANAVTLLVSLGWKGFGISEQVWAVIIIAVGLIIGSITTFVNKDIAYGLVIIWAYLGILIKHLSAGGFAGQYTAVVITVIISLILLLATVAGVLFSKGKSYEI